MAESQNRTEFQTSLRMPRALYERLSTAARENGRGVGEEIRRRLSASFELEPLAVPIADAPTQRLISALTRMAASFAQWFGPWHASPAAGRLFRRSVSKLLLLMGPPESDDPRSLPTPRPGSVAAELFASKPTLNAMMSALVAGALSEEPDQ